MIINKFYFESTYKRLEKNHELIFDKWWLEKDYHYGDSAYYPKSMSPDDLKEGCKEILVFS